MNRQSLGVTMKNYLMIATLISMFNVPAYGGGWTDVEKYIPVRQQAFCNLMNQYEIKAEEAEESKNQIKQNEVNEKRGDDLLALMPNGAFTNWLVEVREVVVIPNGDAAYEMRLQCGVSVGSGRISEGENYAATAKKGSVIYKQLAGVSAGDFILVNGRLIKFGELNKNDGRLAFASMLRGKNITKFKRFNDRVKYFADVRSLAKFTTK
jgi:hypothetical protein